MDLEEFKALNLQRNVDIEYTRCRDYAKSTRPAYYLSLTEELPIEWAEGRAKTPFIEVAHSKDKNGCAKDTLELPLEEILYLFQIGRSNLI